MKQLKVINITLYLITVLYEMSQILNCGIDREALSILLLMIENNTNPEALAAVVKEMKKENHSK